MLNINGKQWNLLVDQRVDFLPFSIGSSAKMFMWCVVPTCCDVALSDEDDATKQHFRAAQRANDLELDTFFSNSPAFLHKLISNSSRSKEWETMKKRMILAFIS